MSLDKLEKWYRYSDGLSTSAPYITLLEFYVNKKTEKGVWIDYCGRPKFVLRDAKKRFACPTKEEALESFKARKKRQLKIHKGWVERIERILQEVETWEKPEDGTDHLSFIDF